MKLESTHSSSVFGFKLILAKQAVSDKKKTTEILMRKNRYSA